METQEKIDKLTNWGKLLLLVGLITVVGLLLITLLFGDSFTIRKMLQIRLAIIGIGIAYCLSIYFYLHQTIKKLANGEKNHNGKNGIIIYFNGKKIGQ